MAGCGYACKAVSPVDQDLRREWEALAEKSGASPFARAGWYEAWWRAFGSGRLELATARHGDHLAAVLPLRRSRVGLLSVSNWHTPEVVPVLGAEGHAEDLANELISRAGAYLDLSFVSRESTWIGALLRRASAAGWTALTRTIERSPFVDIAGRDWTDLETTLAAKRRRDMRRRQRRLVEEVGETRLDCHVDAQDLDPALVEGFAIEATGWKGRRRSAILSAAETRQFYTEIAHWAASRGWLRLCFLRASERAIAFAFCISHGGVFHVLKIGFDQRWSRYAPGTLLTREMLRAATESGHQRYEFHGDADTYKLVWTDQLHHRTRVQLFRPTPAGRGSYAAWRFGRPAAKRAVALLRRTG